MEVSASEAGRADELEGRAIVRRFSDRLAGATPLETLVQRAQEEQDEDERDEHELRLQALYKNVPSSESSRRDFDDAEVAQEELRKAVEKYKADLKVPFKERLGFHKKTVKAQAVDVLERSVDSNFDELQLVIDDLQQKWSDKNGKVSTAFKRVGQSLERHKTVLSMFPSQNNYASTLCGGLSCLMQAARTHSDITQLLSESIATASEKVTICADYLMMIQTPRVRRLMAGIYARMFRLYRMTIEWYLSSRTSRLFQSFNENLVKDFQGAVDDISQQVEQLRSAANVASFALNLMMDRKVTMLIEMAREQRRTMHGQNWAGHEMSSMLLGQWKDARLLQEFLLHNTVQAAPPPSVPQTDRALDAVPSVAVTTRAAARTHIDAIQVFVVGDEGQKMHAAGKLWLAEPAVLSRLQAWMSDTTASRTLWILTSHYEPRGVVSGARAAALATVAAAWQASAPIVSHFCERPEEDSIRDGMTVEQVGLLGLVHSLIRQLLDFSDGTEELGLDERDLNRLDGNASSWPLSLQVLRVLLDFAPGPLFCVVDGLNHLAMGGSEAWCSQVLEILTARQSVPGKVFKMLFTTTGNSHVLPDFVRLEDRILTTKTAREISKSGMKIPSGFTK